MKITGSLRASLSASILLFLSSAFLATADDLISLDDPEPSAPTAKVRPNAAPAPKGDLESLDSLDSIDSLDDSSAGLSENAAAGGEDGAIDLGNAADSFNPYIFSRNSTWGFLPIAALILVGLHLLRIPKRKSKRKIDQARRFFRGISGEGTNSSILVTTSVPSDPKGGK